MEPQPSPKGEGSPLDAAVYNMWSLLRKLQAEKSAWMPIFQQKAL